MKNSKENGFSFEVCDIAKRAMINADCIGAGRRSYVKQALVDNKFDGIANSDKLLDALVFSVEFIEKGKVER